MANDKISQVTLPNGTTYDIEDIIARQAIPNAASIDANGLITFKNGNTSLFTLQLPIYDGSHHSASNEG